MNSARLTSNLDSGHERHCQGEAWLQEHKAPQQQMRASSQQYLWLVHILLKVEDSASAEISDAAWSLSMILVRLSIIPVVLVTDSRPSSGLAKLIYFLNDYSVNRARLRNHMKPLEVFNMRSPS